jgi:cyclopropane fatty-acyl-phospholipid synthase-like methyltransferase
MAKKAEPIAPRNVVNLYDFTGVTPLAGIQDYSEGIYEEDPSINYEVAQKNQHNYLLDEIGAKEDFRFLDVGCGLGTLLETAKERGVKGTGITISEDQVAKCRSKGLDVHLFNYKHLPPEWDRKFDAIIANGSLEHFCQPEEAIEGKQDQVYREMFKIFARLLDPTSFSQKVATTAIHFRDKQIDPRKFLRSPFLQLFDTEGFHASILYRGYGGYYPGESQLEKCASNYFILVKEVDGTEDYRLTSEHWCKQYNKAIFSNPKFINKILGHFLKKPMHTFWTVASYVGFQSWPWQFRGEPPRAKLYRHTWQRLKE